MRPEEQTMKRFLILGLVGLLSACAQMPMPGDQCDMKCCEKAASGAMKCCEKMKDQPCNMDCCKHMKKDAAKHPM